MVSTKFYYNVRDTQEQLQQQQQQLMFYETYVSEKIHICTKTPVLETLFYKLCYKEIATQMFSCKYSKVFKNIFFMKHLRWLLLQTLLKKDVPKNFTNSNRIFRYRSHFLSSCRTITCNFINKEGPVRVFCCEF